MRKYITHLIIGFISLSLNDAQVHTAGGPVECFCLPPNQICDPTRVVPRNAIRITVPVDTRILNQNPESLCDQHRIPCCFGVIGGPGGGSSGGGSNIGGCGTSNRIEIKNLADEANFGEYPWMALIVDENHGFVASGALISQQHIITAAHKIKHNQKLFVRLGDYDISSEFDRQQHPVQTIPVADIITHPGYDARSKDLKNDLAIVMLSHPASYAPHIRPVCLPEKNQKFHGQRCYVSGWGKRGINGQYQAIMKEVDLPIVESLSCEALLRTTKLSQHFQLHRSFMCAGGEQGKDACEGDGGSPLVCKEHGKAVAVGLVAWGHSCGTRIPGVYVNLEYMSDFIHRYV